MNEFISITPCQQPEKLWVIIDQSMIEHSLRWEFMDHYAVQRRQVVNDLKSIELIGHMLGGSEIRHQVVFAFVLRRDAVKIQVERNALGTAVDIDGSVLEPEPV